MSYWDWFVLSYLFCGGVMCVFLMFAIRSAESDAPVRKYSPLNMTFTIIMVSLMWPWVVHRLIKDRKEWWV